MKAVIYSLSPFQQKVMTGLWKDLPDKIHHKVSENWISATLLLAPLVGVYSYVQNYQEKEKLEHRKPNALFYSVIIALLGKLGPKSVVFCGLY
ncbi:Ubiquinol-cytochrome c reductase complex ubiquinone-binding protein QP-C, putative [Ricinus communis]|uniref:Ubiquinol-cytochrome c reductase complex ubiquinone-binding protein QP-C, putative n=1 Tax=Ricinus communis TaxID=3988 RepID=B9T522_RICCO|nr:Ubiquinol-cytochrome c reductase complex ubiquinone-binding protein QP-C, putative [Ricinus communis]